MKELDKDTIDVITGIVAGALVAIAADTEDVRKSFAGIAKNFDQIKANIDKAKERDLQENQIHIARPRIHHT